jgi:hypothetical protein
MYAASVSNLIHFNLTPSSLQILKFKPPLSLRRRDNVYSIRMNVHGLR